MDMPALLVQISQYQATTRRVNMSTATFKRAHKISRWRRLALHLWREPRDPTVYGNLEINMSRALEYLEKLNSGSGRTKVTVTHLVIKAIAKAVAEFPDANAIIAGKRIFCRDSVDVYCQVATGGGNDLSGLKIADADRKSAQEIAEELCRRVDGVHAGTDPGSERTKRAVDHIPRIVLGPLLRVIDFLTYTLLLDLSRLGVAFDQFGSAMVSNVGSFGIGHGLAPLVPASHVPIVLLVGEIVERPVVVDGQIAIAPCMTIGATFDHRLIDGFQAGKMAATVKRSLADPFVAFGLATLSSSADGHTRRFHASSPDESSSGQPDSEYKVRKPGFVRNEDPPL